MIAVTSSCFHSSQHKQAFAASLHGKFSQLGGSGGGSGEGIDGSLTTASMSAVLEKIKPYLSAGDTFLDIGHGAGLALHMVHYLYNRSQPKSDHLKFVGIEINACRYNQSRHLMERMKAVYLYDFQVPTLSAKLICADVSEIETLGSVTHIFCNTCGFDGDCSKLHVGRLFIESNVAKLLIIADHGKPGLQKLMRAYGLSPADVQKRANKQPGLLYSSRSDPSLEGVPPLGIHDTMFAAWPGDADTLSQITNFILLLRDMETTVNLSLRAALSEIQKLRGSLSARVSDVSHALEQEVKDMLRCISDCPWPALKMIVMKAEARIAGAEIHGQGTATLFEFRSRRIIWLYCS
ncbi:hypothetical protein CEUSTIGMA_g12745.t1 [Chlamydomonas eustigma]|uniref:DOT1 domain-containing protein n=1 Tax=Chlamydomonas eustigma TaxID=1157962 RepID=A0A250XQJ3_9CHLO|nr:hypothetical protein CEUSTIGMA_g12745.t1 [Chlamydomonas eustigma]|eukprot:GAX85328.1 hypothetical protein CEUSTIGMA_g12745.t1 [Chlamydomonas eustigma]